MRVRIVVLTALTIALVLFGVAVAQAQDPEAQSTTEAQAAVGSAFTYQGRLTDSRGNPVTDTCDVTFSLWDAGGTSGNQLGGNHTVSDIEVTNGRFTTEVNTGDEFGLSAFSGDARWLQIAVRCGSETNFTVLSRQRLRPAPYAHFAVGAPWDGLSSVPASPTPAARWRATTGATRYTAASGVAPLQKVNRYIYHSLSSRKGDGSCTSAPRLLDISECETPETRFSNPYRNSVERYV